MLVIRSNYTKKGGKEPLRTLFLASKQYRLPIEIAEIALSFFLAGCGAAKGTTHQPAWPFVPPTLVVLGDSVSAGQYLPSNDDAYPRLLATDLHARCHSSAHVFSLLL